MKFWLEQGLASDFPQLASFPGVLSADGELFRDLPQRQTLRVQSGGRSLFIKRHLGVGWGEIVKNYLQLRAPVVSAQNEFLAIKRLEALRVDTLSCVGFGEQGGNPARRQSFIITEDLVGSVSLEDYCAGWANEPLQPTRRQVKRVLIKRLASVAQRLHDQGVNHRDFYICHFHIWPDQLAKAVNEQTALAARTVLIDLHRVQIRRRLPARWRLKDVAGLYFSAMDAGLTRRDCLRFVRQYRPGALRQTLSTEARFWRKVERQARKLYFKAHRRYPPVTWPSLSR